MLPGEDKLDLATDVTRRDLRPLIERHFAVDSKPQIQRAASEVRRRLGQAITRGDVPNVISGYLALARLHIDGGAFTAAAGELEEGIDVVTRGEGPATQDAPEDLWRLLLPLAFIYARVSDHVRATKALDAARQHADRHQSAVGRERARLLSALIRRA